MTYWLSYINSFALALSGTPDTRAKWRVILVGTRADKNSSYISNKSKPHLNTLATPLSAKSIQSWQHEWPDLPLHAVPFFVSREDAKSIRRLLVTLKDECEAIMATSTIQIPKQYFLLLEQLQQQNNAIVQVKDLNHLVTKDLNLNAALHYLHDVGDIVLLPDGLVCTHPSEISELMAQFISPECVRNLPFVENRQVEVLSSEQVGRVLSLKQDDPR